MKRSSQVAVAVLLASLAGSAIAVRSVERMRPAAGLEEVLYIPSSKIVQRLSLGYSGLTATLYWTRAVQYFGNKHLDGAMRYDLLYPLLDMTTDLDPKLHVAYQFGSVFLSQEPPHGAGQFDKAVALIEKGIRNNPNDWRYYYSLGFLYFENGEHTRAAETFLKGSELPKAHPWLKNLAAVMAQSGGDIQTARFLWTQTYENTEDPQIKANALRRLAALTVDEQVPQLQALVRRFAEQTGTRPLNFLPLVQAGWLRSIPTDPVGNPYQITPTLEVIVAEPEALPFIKHGRLQDGQSKQRQHSSNSR